MFHREITTENPGLVYCITNILNGKKYVGKKENTTDFDSYWGSGILIKRAIQKYGLQNFKKEVLATCSSYEELNEKERWFIAQLNSISPSGYNLASGGNGGFTVAGFTLEEHEAYKQKIRNTLAGRPRSEETKQKIREARKKPLSEEAREKIRRARLGKKHTEEAKEKNRQAHLGKKRNKAA